MGKKFTFDFSVDAWIQGVEIEADDYADALDELRSMSLDELIENGYVKDFDISNIDVDFDTDDFDEEDEEDDLDELEFDTD